MFAIIIPRGGKEFAVMFGRAYREGAMVYAFAIYEWQAGQSVGSCLHRDWCSGDFAEALHLREEIARVFRVGLIVPDAGKEEASDAQLAMAA